MRSIKGSYTKRASVFDRMLILMMGLSCVVLVNIVAKPCAESMKTLREMSNVQQRSRASPSSKSASVEKESKDESKPRRHLKENTGGNDQETEKKEFTVKAPSSKKTDFFTAKNKQDSSSLGIVTKKAPSLWKNKYGVVHVMWTRFMQLQPDLMHLGKARIELFKTLTLRSMREQSTKEYLWVIFTDPELEPELLHEIVDLVKIHDNILLVGMNVGFKDFRHGGWASGIETVFSGDIQMLYDYQEAAQTHVYVETRIDADDAMYQDFMRRIQAQAARTLGASAKEAKYDVAKLSKTPEFRVFCAEHHLEWGYFNPWEPESKKGHLFGVSAPEFCITAGLTYAFQIGTDPEGVKIAHHRLDKTHPQCKGTQTSNCIDRIDAGDFKYVMIRSRTPTSAGMAGVIPTDAVKKSTQWRDMQDQVWNQYIFWNFAVTPKSIWELRAYLTDHMEGILQDALAGQCTRADFTCKKSSRDALTNLLLEVKKYSGGDSKKTKPKEVTAEK